MVKARALIYVSGKVQGVFFRQNTMKKAQSVDVLGWVKNLDDGRVEAVLEGEEETVKAVIEFCKVGPKGAQVIEINVNWELYRGEFQSFNIVY